jgi:hypothetical protein
VFPSEDKELLIAASSLLSETGVYSVVTGRTDLQIEEGIIGITNGCKRK